MDYHFSVFLIEPTKIVVYSFDDENGKPYIYNAGSLKPFIANGTGHSEIQGYVINHFGVQPVIIGNDQDEYQIIYAPLDSPHVYCYDGKPAIHQGNKIISHSFIMMPDIDKSVISGSSILKPVGLPSGSKESVQRFISMSHQNKEQNTVSYQEYKKLHKNKLNCVQPPNQEDHKNPKKVEDHEKPKKVEDHKKPKKVEDHERPKKKIEKLKIEETKVEKIKTQDVPIVSALTISPPKESEKESADHSHNICSPGPQLMPVTSPKYSNYVDLDEYNKLKTEVRELKDLVRAMNQRLYQIYPVNMPPEIKIDNKKAIIISVDDVQSKIDNQEIDRFILDPMIQSYAGSHRSNNRFLTYYGKDGNVYLVRAEFDPKTNKITSPN